MRYLGPICVTLAILAAGCGSNPVVVDFDDLTAITTAPPASAPVVIGDRFTVGQELVVADSDIRLIVLPFQWNGASSSPGCPPGWSSNGFVEIEQSTRAGGTGNELHFNNASLAVASPKRGKVTDLKIKFADLGGNINLGAGGVLRNDGDFGQIPSPIPLSSPPVTLTVTPPNTRGTLQLSGEMSQFSYPFPCPAGLTVQDYWTALGGGQELWMDDLELTIAAPDPQKLRPDATGATTHVRDQASPSQTGLHALVDEVTPSDTDSIVSGGGSTGTVTLSLDQMATPYSDANWTLRTRYEIAGHSGGTWSLQAWLLESNDTTVLWGPTTLASGSSDTPGWVLDEETFTGNVAWDTNPSVKYQVVTTGTDQIIRASGESNGDAWVDEGGDPSNAYTSLVSGDSTYVSSGVVGAFGTTSYRADFVLSDPLIFLGVPRPGAVQIRWQKPQDGIATTVALLQGATQIATWSLGTAAAQPAFTTTSLDLSASEWNAITDFSDLHLEWTLTGGLGTQTTEVVPTADAAVGVAWTNDGGGAGDLYQDVDDTGDSNEITGTTTSIAYDTNPKRQYDVELDDYVYPGVDTGHKLVFEARSSAAFPVGPGNLEIELWAGNVQIMAQSLTVDSTAYTVYELPLSSSQVASVKADPTNLWVRLRVQSSSGTTANHKIDFIHLETPVPAELFIADAWLSFPPASYGGISWVELEVP